MSVTPKPRVAFVVHRYHPEIAGGAERHCRDMAQHMSRHWDVTVLTSCARDYRTWANVYEPGESPDRAVRVIRVPVSVERDYRAFDALSVPVLAGGAGLEEENQWIEAQGPVLPGLLEHLRRERDSYDLLVFFTYLYWSTVRGIVEVGKKAWLVPTAHDEKPIRLDVYDRVFAAPWAILYNTAAEKRFCAGRFARRAEVEEVVGCGVDSVSDADVGGSQAGRIATAPLAHARGSSRGTIQVSSSEADLWCWADGRPLEPGYLLYVGRVDKAKNVDVLVEQYVSLVKRDKNWPDLVLVGPVSMDLPTHPKIRPVGYVDEDAKRALMRGASALLQPSAFESLSLVLLESWLCGTPVLVNGACEVMRDQVVAAHGGLYYDTPHQFREGLTCLLSRPRLGEDMARAGRAFTEANYSWDVIERKYLALYERFSLSNHR